MGRAVVTAEPATASDDLALTGSGLDLRAVADVARRRRRVVLAPEAQEAITASWQHVTAWGEQQRPVYGVNTGFGEMAHVAIPPQDGARLQVNLLRGHACSSGESFPEDVTRAMLLARANALAKGYSGVAPRTVALMLDFLNRGIHPVVYTQGSLGASGDLAPLSHLALPLIGEGDVWYRGEVRPAAEALRAEGLEPVTLGYKEGLALINGTSAMTGCLAVTLLDAVARLDDAVGLASLFVQALGASHGAFDGRGHELKEHPGQRAVAGRVRELVAGTALMRDHAEIMEAIEAKMHAEPGVHDVGVFIQNAYTVRCVPQILGPVVETMQFAARIVERELNSCNDNPLIFGAAEETFHGGHFHGQYVAMAADYLAIALTEIGVLAERQLNRLVDPALNNPLPDFLALREGGLAMGLMGAQYLATSVASENLDLAAPSSVKSIPSNGQNQDVVSMGLNAARRCRLLTVNVGRILSVLAAGCVQSAELIGRDQFSEWARGWLACAGEVASAHDESVPIGLSLRAIEEWMGERGRDPAASAAALSRWF
jgi:histidine ammonia-lyase